MKEGRDWLWDILACPECDGALAPGPDEGAIVCGNPSCGYRSTRNGRIYNLLPRELDPHQAAEHSFRLEVYERLAGAAPGMDDGQLLRFQLFNILTNYPFTNQYVFFRDHFFRNHHLAGRGLEIGGSTGEASGFIKLFYPETEMVTSDVAPINVTMAAHLAELFRFGTDYFVLADAERLPFRPASFDFIFSSGMLHHLGDLPRGLQRGRQALKPGGRWYVVNELAIGSLFRLFWNSRWGGKGREARERGVRENSYALQEWKSFIEEQGFQIVDCQFQRTPRPRVNWLHTAYHSLVSRLPASLLKLGIPCEVCFVLEKSRVSV
jgi:SAM-dependent methyltransferase